MCYFEVLLVFILIFNDILNSIVMVFFFLLFVIGMRCFKFDVSWFFIFSVGVRCSVVWFVFVFWNFICYLFVIVGLLYLVFCENR